MKIEIFFLKGQIGKILDRENRGKFETKGEMHHCLRGVDALHVGYLDLRYMQLHLVPHYYTDSSLNYPLHADDTQPFLSLDGSLYNLALQVFATFWLVGLPFISFSMLLVVNIASYNSMTS